MEASSHLRFKHIKGDPDGGELRGCYFKETQPGSGEFTLHAPDHSVIPTEPSPIPNNSAFTFTTVHEFTWSLIFDYSEPQKLHGHGSWSAVHAKSFGNNRPSIGNDDPESGTFQAQGGPGTGTDDDLSASASA